MALQLLYLGKLADLAGAASQQWEVEARLDWDGVLSRMEPELRAEIVCDKVRIALNGALLADKTALCAGDGDEIAFLPPVSGG